ncbi:MAG: hypothetical protein PHV47_02795 [Candidatus Pacebacteria bacterium]|nr:hypothetical protein [Candidatus Paceibacterota bacterium]
MMSQSKKNIYSQEKKYCLQNLHNRDKKDLPKFSYGEEFFIEKTSNPEKTLLEFSKSWMDNPWKYLDLKNFKLPKISYENNIISFPSILNGKEDKAVFCLSFPPKIRTNKEISAIIVPHWNAVKSKCLLGTNLVRGLFLPISTAIYFPEHGKLTMDKTRTQYEIIGPNIGLTLFRFWQDILNLKYLSFYLKNNLKFKKIGYWSFSLGSPRAMVASLFPEVPIDFLMMHFLADSFTESLMKGLGTQEIAEVIKPNIDYHKLEEIWRPLDPGSYIKHMNKLPKNTRLVQGKYDLVFGIENTLRINQKIKKYLPSVELEEGEFGHLGIIKFNKNIPIMIRDSKFMKKILEI